jgi:hypothetical protein
MNKAIQFESLILSIEGLLEEKKKLRLGKNCKKLKS